MTCVRCGEGDTSCRARRDSRFRLWPFVAGRGVALAPAAACPLLPALRSVAFGLRFGAAGVDCKLNGAEMVARQRKEERERLVSRRFEPWMIGAYIAWQQDAPRPGVFC